MRKFIKMPSGDERRRLEIKAKIRRLHQKRGEHFTPAEEPLLVRISQEELQWEQRNERRFPELAERNYREPGFRVVEDRFPKRLPES